MLIDWQWIVGALLAIGGLAGLFVSSRAETDVFYIGGLVMFVAAVGGIFWLMKWSFDQVDAARRATHRKNENDSDIEKCSSAGAAPSRRDTARKAAGRRSVRS